MREIVTMWRHTKMPGAPGLTEGRRQAEGAESERADA
jgi:hypothetical protein